MVPLSPIFYFLFFSFQSILGSLHERNSYLEYCSNENPGNKDVCRDAQAMKEFTDKQLRVRGVFITYDKNQMFEEIIFGYGQCITRPKGTYIKLLPWAMWYRRVDLPLVIVISETIDLYTSYADRDVQIPLVGGKSHVFVLNGELRSFRGDVHRRCVAPNSDLHGFTEYHFSDKEANNYMEKYVITPKDKIYLGKDVMKECEEYGVLDAKRDIFLKKTWKDVIPRTFTKCALECSNSDISVIKARNGTGLVDRDEDAGLHGLLVLYAMNETDKGYRKNRLYSPTANNMLLAMYDTEVDVGQHLTRQPLPKTEQLHLTDRARARLGRSVTNLNDPQKNQWLSEIMASEDALQPQQKRVKRLSYSSAVMKSNALPSGGGGQNEMQCIG